MTSSAGAGPLPRVAVLGAGTMGRGMTHSLLRATGSRWTCGTGPRNRAAELAADGAVAHEDAAGRGRATQTWSSPWSRTRTR